MGHKTLIGGTAYEIKGGKTLIGGTAYDIKSGKTLIGGTGYNISFAPPREQTISALLADASITGNEGRNAKTTGHVGFSYTVGTPVASEYCLSFCYGYMSINKVIWDGHNFTTTLIYRQSTSYGNIHVDDANARIRYSNDGSADSSVYGATLITLKFNNYTDSEVATIFGNATYSRSLGRNSNSSGAVQTAISSGNYYYFVACGADFGYSKVDATNDVITNNIGTNTTNPSLLIIQSDSNFHRARLSLTGSAYSSVNGGSIIRVTAGS